VVHPLRIWFSERDFASPAKEHPKATNASGHRCVACAKGKVRVRGHGADWVVKIDTAPTSVEHKRELESKVWELIDGSNIGLGGGYSIDF
jgi:hypothetical protein